MDRNDRRHFIVWSLIVLSRIPFIFTGFGSEEDAWGLILNAERIASNGAYEVSRLPGHPLQEIIYAFIYKAGPVVLNLLTVLISTAGIYAFGRIIRKYKPENEQSAVLALAFIPVIFINSINVMDYTWAMSGILGAWYFLEQKKYITSGVLTGLAVGCRITSGAVLAPFLLYIFLSGEKNKTAACVKTVMATLIVAVICFIPVINTYGISFFTYYEHFPIPGILKNIYKGTIGVAGLPGLIILLFALAVCFKSLFKNNNIINENRALLATCLSASLLFIIAFARLPLKSAFLIPVLPFIIAIPAVITTHRNMIVLALGMIFSSFFAGVNLADINRGSRPSSISITKNISGLPVSFDLLKGPVIADHEKQETLITFSQQVITECNTLKTPSVIICGWYLNYIEYHKKSSLTNSSVNFVYYINADSISTWENLHYSVYYLPLQDEYNDLRFGISNTSGLAKPLVIGGLHN